ncbi:Zn-dependent hydrolase [Amnibacterium flavum]|uniref:Zn-dependent hydrolase n=1 Tax=Amnibacterium flavum TaxID=2173173 RepID=UPI00140376A7|nr:Zn-dependent hydrolase [Amnibacterium flavum]
MTDGGERGLTVDGDRLVADLERLAEFGVNEAGGIDRTSFSAADLAARQWLIARCEEAGLEVAVDGIGNIVVSSPDLEAGLADQAPVWTGSHIDAVPNGGRFDGPLGSLAAIECLRRLHEERVPLARPVRAVVYTDEEGNYAHLFGSSALTRGFSVAELSNLVGRDGDRFADTFAASGGDLDAAAEVRLAPGALHATVELHIEQGPLLERQGIQIGVVTGIVAIGGGAVRFTGQADHAGTTPMIGRRDSVVAAAEFITLLPALAPRVGPAAVVTTGIVRAEPGGSNVIAEAAEVVVDYRDPSTDNARELEALIAAVADEVASRHGSRVETHWEDIVPAAPLHSEVRDAIRASAEQLGYSSVDIASGAGHDSQNLATLAPTGMIFVPSTGGRSHSPAEHTPWPDVVRGADTLLGTVIRLAS